MATQVQFRRGSDSEHNSFTGVEGEITVNTTNKSIHVHDGSTVGGTEAARADLSNINNVGVITATEYYGTFKGTIDSGVSIDSAAYAESAGIATALENSRNFSVSGDASSPSVSFDGTGNVDLVLTLANTNVSEGSYGSATEIPTFSVDSKGRLTSAGTTSIVTDLTVSGDSGSESISLATETLTISGGSNLNSSASNNGVTINLDENISLANISASGVVTATRFFGDFSGDVTGNVTGNLVGIADSASKLATSRNISLGGDLSGSASFDGSSNVTITATVTDDSHNHVISNVDGLQTALDAKAPLDSPALTGTPTAPTAAAGTNTTQVATTAFVSTAVSNLVDTAPATLDTLNELAAALGDDPNFATTVSNQIGTKLDASSYTASDVLTKIKTVDGAASGLDADLLDGQQGSYYTNASNINAGTIGDAYLPATISSDITGNAGTATSLSTARTIGLSGDVSGSVSFDGSSNVTITATVADDSHNHVISNVDGLQTALDAKLDSSSYTASDVLTKIKTVDGASSGLDADLLDGQQGSYYLDWTNVTNKPDPVITLAGDLSGSVTLTDLGSGTLTATIAANSVALGSDTTGNYVAAGAVSGNGLSGSSSSEGGTFTVSSNATETNTANTLVFRDASGNFSAGIITASTFSGNVTGTVSDISNHDTGDLSEGSNLYYTNSRARSAISVTDNGGDGSLSYNSTTGTISYTGPSASEVRSHFTEGTGISIASGEVSVNPGIISARSQTDASSSDFILFYDVTDGQLKKDTIQNAALQGPQGFQGRQGAQGVQGAQGFQGVQGAVGSQGEQGAQGFQGVQGAVGAQGSVGAQGAQGRQGAVGAQGSVGAQGAQGVQGAVGAQGAQGRQGAQGAQGFQGNDGNFGGATFDYTFSTTTTNADPGTGTLRFNATDISTASALYIDDTDDNAIDIQSFLRTIDDSTSTIKGHFRISNKINSNDFAIFTISSISENTGYFTVNCSYVSGSATAFSNAEDIIITFARTGDKGDLGPQGFQGVQGAVGAQGAQGFQGVQGATGPTGPTGPQGVQGAVGAQGAQGRQGAQGAQGFQGVQGATGPTGPTGPQGNQGRQGANGANGATGPQGVQGATGSFSGTFANNTWYSSADARERLYFSTNSHTYIKSSDDIIFRTENTDTNNCFIASGSLTAVNVNSTSDEKLKDNIKTLENALEKVLALRGVEYDRNDIEGYPHQIGVIAQEVEKIIPEVISESKDGTKHVAYGNLTAMLIEAIKEQQGQINTMKSEIENIKNEG